MMRGQNGASDKVECRNAMGLLCFVLRRRRGRHNLDQLSVTPRPTVVSPSPTVNNAGRLSHLVEARYVPSYSREMTRARQGMSKTTVTNVANNKALFGQRIIIFWQTTSSLVEIRIAQFWGENR